VGRVAIADRGGGSGGVGEAGCKRALANTWRRGRVGRWRGAAARVWREDFFTSSARTGDAVPSRVDFSEQVCYRAGGADFRRAA
jgi:hypothetical protein